MLYQCVVSLSLVVFLAGPLSATDPFPYTWIKKKKDTWEHLHGYLGGSAIVLEDEPRNKKERLWLSDLIKPANFSRYVKESTAGPIWAENALAYFLTIEGQQHFCIRLGWGERIVINLDAFKPVPASSVNENVLAAEEIKTVRHRLLEAVSLLGSDDEKKFATSWSKVENAISLVGRLKLMELVPLVQRLEECSHGSVLPFFADNSSVGIRRAAQFTLRRVGIKPQGYPATSLPKMGSFNYRPFDKPFPERANHADEIHADLHAGFVIEILGMPDYINSVNYVDPNRISPTYWRYDMDTDPPYTLLITLHKNIVYSVKRLEPPVWKEMDKIEEGSPRPIFKSDGDLEWSTEWEAIERHYLGIRVWHTSYWLLGTFAIVFGCLYFMRRKMKAKPLDAVK